jgi:hypothetical protein
LFPEELLYEAYPFDCLVSKALDLSSSGIDLVIDLGGSIDTAIY